MSDNTTPTDLQNHTPDVRDITPLDFAAYAALQGLIACGSAVGPGPDWATRIAQRSYALADAMEAERLRRQRVALTNKSEQPHR